jgi:hypothetical protein
MGFFPNWAEWSEVMIEHFNKSDTLNFQINKKINSENAYIIERVGIDTFQTNKDNPLFLLPFGILY